MMLGVDRAGPASDAERTVDKPKRSAHASILCTESSPSVFVALNEDYHFRCPRPDVGRVVLFCVRACDCCVFAQGVGVATAVFAILSEKT